MTIDIEKLIEEIDEDGSGQIEFDEFTALLSGAKNDDDEDEDD
jgi:Ca2+-binding EF-hand superfamily protein